MPERKHPLNCSSTHSRAVYLVLFLLLVQVAWGQSTSKKADRHALRLFMIGNSFSQNASKYLPELSQEAGHTLIIGRAELGGCSLERHWDHAQAAERNPEDPKGKPYHGKSLKMLLAEGTWDVITLQQASILSGNLETYQPYARQLYEYVKKLQPQAKIVLHQTWAYRVDSKDFTQIGNGQSARSAQQMWEKSRAAYHATAKELGIPLIPNGDAFWAISSDPQWGYKKDTEFNFDHPRPPALPKQNHSLHVGYFWKQDELGFDSHHANAAGCYLGSLVWYSFLFQESPLKLSFHPQEVDADFAEQLKKTAWKTVSSPKKKQPVLK
ncbi:DUF4886 domain-containing protein [Siphonobacter sp. BAB-5385]|uniref:DUF4886 domain-containing protein n=1 Tax=Siphonobacter sp. BAB-5385 TaxID=1864822 RepID=UPI000B9DD48A|nr:DUF4886 domain-containing protein [Siphonobacter sp. BAB-5385]OZI06831.1 DUF4886 domain-containing protein [Siphonobacter sp. BAB-5385]